MPEILAIIPARGGSKSLPRKNVLLLGGIPLIAHTIRAAQASSLVTRVVVSTEDAEISMIARRFGADVVDRPAELAGDEATSESALLHALDSLETEEGYRPDILCFLQCTSPLTSPEDIDGVLSAMLAANSETALAVTRFHYFVWREDAEASAVGVNHDKAVRQRRQDRESEYLETGAVYAMDVEGFRVAQHRFFGRTVFHEIPASRVLEIDDPDDFTVAAARLDSRQQTASRLPARVDAIAFDFDGVFTDDCVLVDEHGTEAVRCSRRDGMGVEMLHKAGLPMIVLSKERNAVVARRCEKLRLEYRQGQDSKIGALRAWLVDHGLDAQHVVYMGNDVNDLECMSAVGCAVAPADAHPQALAASSVVLRSDGGKGAVRELADMILGARP
ncbi:cytidylyltransferase domain-containing protein [Mycolicibacterium frederiksbergense]|uniref:cytidylyltransferase domain-containing protein n=1 Tax=Mycolicibacterium frederiksbergense TaxID=117567 RepID=UPI00399BFDED